MEEQGGEGRAAGVPGGGPKIVVEILGMCHRDYGVGDPSGRRCTSFTTLDVFEELKSKYRFSSDKSFFYKSFG